QPLPGVRPLAGRQCSLSDRGVCEQQYEEDMAYCAATFLDPNSPNTPGYEACAAQALLNLERCLCYVPGGPVRSPLPGPRRYPRAVRRLRGTKMFERYTEIAKQTIVFAKGEAAQLGSPEIGTEHILLALLRDEDVTSRLMEGLSVSQIRQDILAHASHRQELPPPVDLPLSTQSRKLLSLAEKEAEGLADRYVSNSHILLGLLRLGDSHAQLLKSSGLSPDRVRTLIASAPKHEDARTVDLGESLGLS